MNRSSYTLYARIPSKWEEFGDIDNLVFVCNTLVKICYVCYSDKQTAILDVLFQSSELFSRLLPRLVKLFHVCSVDERIYQMKKLLAEAKAEKARLIRQQVIGLFDLRALSIGRAVNVNRVHLTQHDSFNLLFVF